MGPPRLRSFRKSLIHGRRNSVRACGRRTCNGEGFDAAGSRLFKQRYPVQRGPAVSGRVQLSSVSGNRDPNIAEMKVRNRAALSGRLQLVRHQASS
jgi:hypothetical protein